MLSKNLIIHHGEVFSFYRPACIISEQNISFTDIGTLLILGLL